MRRNKLRIGCGNMKRRIGIVMSAAACAAICTTLLCPAAFAAEPDQEKAVRRLKPGEAQSFNPQPEPPGDRVTAQTKAWLHGMPGDNTPGGIIVQISAHPADRRATVMIKGNEAAMKTMRSLHERKQRMDQLKLVVRQNPGDKQDTVYTLGNVSIESIKGDSTQTSSIIMSYGRMFSSVAAWGNPGTPSGAHPIVPEEINDGWIHFGETKDPNGVPVDVVSYTEPGATGRIRLTFVGSESLQAILKEFHRVRKDVDMLILMLPNTKTGRYVEYKLAKASIGALVDTVPNRHEAVFNSDVIECYTGAAD